MRIENLSKEIEMAAVCGGNNVAFVGGTTLVDNSGGFQFDSAHTNVAIGASLNQADSTNIVSTITSTKNANMVGSMLAGQYL